MICDSSTVWLSLQGKDRVGLEYLLGQMVYKVRLAGVWRKGNKC